MKWIIRAGDRHLKNSEIRKESTTGDICSGVSVFIMDTDKKPGHKDFVTEVEKCLGTHYWKQAFVFKESQFTTLSQNIPKTWTGKQGFIKSEPPQNHYEIWGFLIDDVKKVFKGSAVVIDIQPNPPKL